jgi:hypothetical protein
MSVLLRCCFLSRGSQDRFNGKWVGPSACLEEVGNRIPTAHQTITTLTELPESLARDFGLLNRSLPKDKTYLYVTPKLRMCGAVPPSPCSYRHVPLPGLSTDGPHVQHDTTLSISRSARRPMHRVWPTKLRRLCQVGWYYKLKHFDQLCCKGQVGAVRARVGQVSCNWQRHLMCARTGTGGKVINVRYQ